MASRKIKLYYVYAYLCIISAKIYIGYTTNLRRRWNEHCIRKDKYPIHRAIQKYGREYFECYVIAKAKSRKEATQKEIKFINHFNTMTPNGYNITKGGEGGDYSTGRKHTRTELKKMSDAQKGKKRGKNTHSIAAEIKRLKTRLAKLDANY